MLRSRWGRTDAGAEGAISGEGGGSWGASDSTGKWRDIESDSGVAIGVLARVYRPLAVGTSKEENGAV